MLDEADALLAQGYTDLIDRLHKQIPKITSDGRRLQTVVCSATLHAFELKKMADRLMHFTWVDLKGEDAVTETVHHVVCIVDPQKDYGLIYVNPFVLMVFMLVIMFIHKIIHQKLSLKQLNYSKANIV